MNSSLKLIVFLVFFTGSGVLAQPVNPLPVSYRNGFFKHFYSNPDSALFYARKLTEKADYDDYLRQALHTDLPFIFVASTKQWYKEQAEKSKYLEWEQAYQNNMDTVYYTVLKLYQDTNSKLVKSIEPIYFFASIARSAGDFKKITSLTKSFIASVLSTKGTYQNKSAAYALYIYQIIERENELNKLSDQLLSTLINKLSTEQIDVDVNNSSRVLLEERAWYRYLYAAANYYKANKLAKSGNFKESLLYFKTASDYSPDLTDQRAKTANFSEQVFFANKQKNLFQTDYLRYLRKYSGDETEVLTALRDMAVNNPVFFKDSLERFYTEGFRQRESFDEFWNKEINVKLAKAPDFTIKTIDGTSYSSSRKAGKWMLIDFWGTWCGLCVEEHPDLQKFDQYIRSAFSGKIELLTVAVNDTEEKVKSYMATKGYTFPVAMSDHKMTKLFNVLGYPTKILISPSGNYLTIPFGIDWVNFVKQYTSL